MRLREAIAEAELAHDTGNRFGEGYADSLSMDAMTVLLAAARKWEKARKLLVRPTAIGQRDESYRGKYVFYHEWSDDRDALLKGRP